MQMDDSAKSTTAEEEQEFVFVGNIDVTDGPRTEPSEVAADGAVEGQFEDHEVEPADQANDSEAEGEPASETSSEEEAPDTFAEDSALPTRGTPWALKPRQSREEVALTVLRIARPTASWLGKVRESPIR